MTLFTNTENRLSDNEFGYLSIHYIVKPPESWYEIPSFKGLEKLKAEIQVRTFAQHIWADVSHIMQYKTEASVPVPVRRSINRVSALLEIVDLEFERVLVDRRDYFDAINPEDANQELNTDLVSKIFDDYFPANNKMKTEKYSDVLRDLYEFHIETSTALIDLIDKYVNSALKIEDNFVRNARENEDYRGTTKKRTEKGVFFSHVGLMRTILEEEYGKKWREYCRKMWKPTSLSGLSSPAINNCPE